MNYVNYKTSKADKSRIEKIRYNISEIRKRGKPTIMVNGKIWKEGNVLPEWVDTTLIKNTMKYVAKINLGLSSSSLSEDTEYCQFKEKIMAELIEDKAKILRLQIQKEIENNSQRFKNVPGKNVNVSGSTITAQKIIDSIDEITDDGAIHIDLDMEPKINANPVRLDSVFKIDKKELKKRIDERLKKTKQMKDQKKREESLSDDKMKKKSKKKKTRIKKEIKSGKNKKS